MTGKCDQEVMNYFHNINDLVRWTKSYFSSHNIYYGHGTDNAFDEAIKIVLPTLGIPLPTEKNINSDPVTIRECNKVIYQVIRRVKERIPVAYLTNKAWFCSYEFYIDERVFIPRSPIGELIENFATWIWEEPKYILDMCTGSGCIAIACSYAFPQARIDAVDISAPTLAVTKHNIVFHGCQNRITPILSDLFHEINHKKYDMIISNPPYVKANDIINLPPEYQFEPVIALSPPGTDGLDIIRRILLLSSDYLTENGILICEVGYQQDYLIQQYPLIPFIWLEFNNGGKGVFMLKKSQLLAYKQYLATVRQEART
ncbi:MAG: 50S ribosomal protein L3 N(5)-glutamine methyltransferase [Candidatus Dasytiphilus stammeri]